MLNIYWVCCKTVKEIDILKKNPIYKWEVYSTIVKKLFIKMGNTYIMQELKNLLKQNPTLKITAWNFASL